MREFDSGATRDNSEGKIDYHGFLSPLVLQAYGEYMLKHQVQADGNLRPSDNWKKGIPKDAYMESLLRHVHDLWMEHDGYESREGIDDALCGVMFNAMGYYHVLLEERLRQKTIIVEGNTHGADIQSDPKAWAESMKHDKDMFEAMEAWQEQLDAIDEEYAFKKEMGIMTLPNRRR